MVVRLRSADVLHSFAIPLLRLGPIDIPAGHTVDVEFDATDPGGIPVAEPDGTPAPVTGVTHYTMDIGQFGGSFAS